jgi:Der1-like family
LQVWRLATHGAIAGGLGFPLLFDLLIVLRFGATLEQSVYSIHPGDYLFMLIFGTGLMSVLSLIMGPLLRLGYIVASGKALVAMITYVWSKEFPEQVRARARSRRLRTRFMCLAVLCQGCARSRVMQAGAKVPALAMLQQQIQQLGTAPACTAFCCAHADNEALRHRRRQALLAAVSRFKHSTSSHRFRCVCRR